MRQPREFAILPTITFGHLIQEDLALYSIDIFKNPLAFPPIYQKITNQIKRVEPQTFSSR